ncbi:glycine cleavage T C-terminal barrel domain-containing protein [Siccirubricoccus deserti]
MRACRRRGAAPRRRRPAGGAGHVTSAYHSAALGRPIALGLLSAGRARLGRRSSPQGWTGCRSRWRWSRRCSGIRRKRLHG